MCATEDDRCVSSERALFTWTGQQQNCINWSSFKTVLRNGFWGVAVLFLASCSLENCIKRSNGQVSKLFWETDFKSVAAVLFACSLFSGKWCFDKLIFSALANFLPRIPEKLRVEKQWLIIAENCPQNGVRGILNSKASASDEAVFCSVHFQMREGASSFLCRLHSRPNNHLPTMNYQGCC